MKAYLLLLACLALTFAGLLQAQDKPNVLIYTHNGKGYVHDNIPACVASLKSICDSNGWPCEASDEPNIFTPEKIKTFDVLVFANTNNETFYTDAQRQVFQQYIQNGGGFVGIHSACGSERNWPWFWANLGGKFRWHPHQQDFDLKVMDPNHPSTDFLPTTWQWKNDECYFIDHLNDDIHVLLAADLTTIELNKDEEPRMKEYPGASFGDRFPLAWCHEFDGGRQWYTALGHESAHYQDPNFVRHITGGIQWVMDRQSDDQQKPKGDDNDAQKRIP
jgi:type 1 glutamine amidotransferase